MFLPSKENPPMGWGQTLQTVSPLVLSMAQGLKSGQGATAYLGQGMAGMMALQERQKEKAANEKLDEMLGTFNVSPAERALLSTMDLGGKQQYLANLMQSRRTGGGGGGSGIDPAMWESIMGGQPSGAPSGAGMLSMGQPVTMGGQERGQLSFGLPEADTGAPLQGAAGMMGQPAPQAQPMPQQRPPMGSPASLSFGQMGQQPAPPDPMSEVRAIELRMEQALRLPPGKTRDAALSTLKARRDLALARAERAAPEGFDTDLANTYRDDLRSESSVANFNLVADGAKTIETLYKNPGAVSDYALAVAFAKIVDPGSVAREGEVNAVTSAGAAFPALARSLNNAIAGTGKMPEDMKAEIARLAARFYNDRAARALPVLQSYQTRVERQGIPFNEVWGGGDVTLYPEELINSIGAAPAIPEAPAPLPTEPAPLPARPAPVVMEGIGEITPERLDAAIQQLTPAQLERLGLMRDPEDKIDYLKRIGALK